MSAAPMSMQGREEMSYPVPARLTHIRQAGNTRATPLPHLGFLVAEAVFLILLLTLTVIVHAHPGPLPGDRGGVLDLQHWLRPHRVVTDVIVMDSTIAWPIPSTITVAVVTALLLGLRRWLDAILVVAITALANGFDFVLDQIVRRPRPSGSGLYVAKHITSSFSFPSGHVLQAMVFLGFLIFLTFQIRGSAPWLWLPRAILLVLIVAMGPSRILEGEHWPSDVLASLIHGAFWLILGIHLYIWLARRRPRLLGRATLHGSGDSLA